MPVCQTCMTFDANPVKKDQKKRPFRAFFIQKTVYTVTQYQLQNVDSVELFESLLQTHDH